MGKTLVNGSGFAKFTKVFSRHCFALYCILRGRIKGFNSSITAIMCQVGSYRTVVGSYRMVE